MYCYRFLLFVFAFLVLCAPCPGQEEASSGRWNPPRAEAFLDGLMRGQMESYSLAGSVVTLVWDGEIVLTKGYGFSDLQNREPVDPYRTLFRIGSITKLFTWTAVMQLYEEGRLELDADVNSYLQEVQVPPTFDQPITLTHLMTHTPGFEDRVVGLFARSPESLIPLVDLLQRDLPARIRPPGEVAAYSNHGTALAGLIVQEVSGQSWSEYVEGRLLRPLGMANSTVRQPPPTHLLPNMSRGYESAGGELRPREFEFVPLAPAGAMSASGFDMGAFMLAHLQRGRLGGIRILEEDTAEEMQRRLYTTAPSLSGMGHGFMLSERNGKQVISHGGDTTLFHTDLVLIPEEEFGLFVSYNSLDGGDARTQFVSAVLDHFFPSVEASDSDGSSLLPETAGRLAQLVGTYRLTRRPQTTLGRMAELMGTVDVRQDRNAGRLVVVDPIEGPRRWVETEPWVFQEWRGDERLAFLPDHESGRIVGYLDDIPVIGFEKLRWYETPSFHFTLLLGSALVLLSALVFPLLSIFVARPRTEIIARRDPAHPAARWLAGFSSLVYLAFLAGFAYLLRDPTRIVYGIPAGLDYLLVLPLIGGASTVILFLVGILAWKGGYWGFLARAHFTLVTLAALAILWQLNYWNLLGWSY